MPEIAPQIPWQGRLNHRCSVSLFNTFRSPSRNWVAWAAPGLPPSLSPSLSLSLSLSLILSLDTQARIDADYRHLVSDLRFPLVPG